MSHGNKLRRFSEPKYYRDDFYELDHKKTDTERGNGPCSTIRRYFGIDPARFGSDSSYSGASTQRCYTHLKLNVRTSFLLSIVVIGLLIAVIEFETNWWFLEDEGNTLEERTDLKEELMPLIVLLKAMIIFFNLWHIIVNTHYHVLKHYLELLRSHVVEEEMVTLWHFPGKTWRLFYESLLTVISPIPFWNGIMKLRVGLSRHDPSAVYRVDIFIGLFMLLLRWKYAYRYIYIRQEIFTKDGLVLSILTGTQTTANLGFRAFADHSPVTLFFISFVSYTLVVAYIHNKLEGPTNYWPEDRWDKEPADPSDFILVKEGHRPVTLWDSYWVHFVAFTTIGFGEYQVQTNFGRFLVVMSFFAGLVTTSFAINILFRKLATEPGEKFLIEKLKVKKMRKIYAQAALTLIQRAVRSFLLRQEVVMLSRGDARRQFSTSRAYRGSESTSFDRHSTTKAWAPDDEASQQRGSPASKQKRATRRASMFFQDDEEVDYKKRLSKDAMVAFNVALFDFRCLRRDFAKTNHSTVDSQMNLRGVDIRTVDTEKMLFDLYADIASITRTLGITCSRTGSEEQKPYLGRKIVESAPKSLGDVIELARKKGGKFARSRTSSSISPSRAEAEAEVRPQEVPEAASSTEPPSTRRPFPRQHIPRRLRSPPSPQPIRSGKNYTKEEGAFIML